MSNFAPKSSKSRRYYQVEEGVPYYPTLRTHMESCCDCGLVHKVRYEIEDRAGNRLAGARLRITAWRHERSTAATRRPFAFDPED